MTRLFRNKKVFPDKDGAAQLPKVDFKPASFREMVGKAFGVQKRKMGILASLRHKDRLFTFVRGVAGQCDYGLSESLGGSHHGRHAHHHDKSSSGYFDGTSRSPTADFPSPRHHD